jgi:solute carrier family 35, member F1/2
MSSLRKDPAIVAATHSTGSDEVSPIHNAPEPVETKDYPQRKRNRFGYLMTKDFWLVLLLGQILALCITGTNTLTTLLVMEGTSIPAFQTFFNYVLLNVIFTSFTVYKYGIKGWAVVIWKDGWKCRFL